MIRPITILALSTVLVLPALAQGERRFGLAKPIEITKEHEVYGSKLAGKPYVELAEILKAPATWKGRKVQVRAEVLGVCQKKGCWMRLGDPKRKQAITVRFVDYSFFVPLDAAKRAAAVEATVVVRVETEAERRHEAEDAGKSPEEIARIKGDEVTVSLLADAVRLGACPEVSDKQKAWPEAWKKAPRKEESKEEGKRQRGSRKQDSKRQP